MTNDKLADAFEKGTAWVGSTEDGFEGATEQIIAALRRQPGPPCEDCGFGLVKGELDRSGQEWWCPICAKAGMRMAENKRLRADLAQAQARCAELEKDAARYRWLRAQPDRLYDDRALGWTPEEADAAIDKENLEGR